MSGEEFDFSTGMPTDEMAQYLQMFVDESTEQLDALVDVLLVLEREPGNVPHLNESFRLIHSIKGAAAMMGLENITLLTHHLENHFERLRSGSAVLDRERMDLVLQCVDYLRDATEGLREGKPITSRPELIEALSLATSSDAVPHAAPNNLEVPKIAAPTSRPPEVRKKVIAYLDSRIELPELRAELIVARLNDLGSIERTSPDAGQFQDLAVLRTLQVWIHTDRSDEELCDAADIVGVEHVEIDLADDPLISGESSVSEDSAEQAQCEVLEVAPRESFAPSSDQAPLPSSATQPRITSQPEPARRDGPKVVETVRVDLQRLDRLLNLTGELIVQRARFVQLTSMMKETFQKSGLHARLREVCDALREQASNSSDGTPQTSSVASGNPLADLQRLVQGVEQELSVLESGRRSFLQLQEAVDQFSRIAEGLQTGVLDSRMIPVGPLFSRFKRTIRDISAELNKNIHLVVRGENTELDKRMIDEIGDPLIHLVRNAIDHGIESEELRLQRGKPAIGTVVLEAEHRGNNVLITVSDDGGGIPIDKVKRRVLDRGLATAAEIDLMSDFDIQQFIWAPGFSTADVVSDISGRGVGMDIVRTRLRELSGTIEVHSEYGKGTRFVLRLPLTLAIIRSLLFQIDEGIFAAPIENVREIVSVPRDEILCVNHRFAVDVRGEYIPLVRIQDVFDWNGQAPRPGERSPRSAEADACSVMIMTVGSKVMGLIVSEWMGCQDIVVKSLDENFLSIRGLAGASILGDGTVCLLLDVSSCMELARQRLREENPRIG